jgi:tetraacyldisaccharide 4'-kinase
LYRHVVTIRNACYDWRLAKVRRVAVPVVSVGNLTLGGTGKTPLVEWLARWFQARGVRVAIVSRGYGARPEEPNDEALELADKLPDTPHVQGRRRVVAAEQAIREHGAALVVLDDAFQHRRIHRDLDIVVLDGLEPFGFERVFPRGMLREPISGLKRANAVVLSRSDALSDQQREAVRQRVRQTAPDAIWLEVVEKPRGFRSAEGLRADANQLAGQPVAAFCGIGNPDGFRHTLGSLGCRLVGFREFPDHHPYTWADLGALLHWLDTLHDVAAVLCTHKDLVKINVSQLGTVPLWALTIESEIAAGREELERELTRLIKS